MCICKFPHIENTPSIVYNPLVLIEVIDFTLLLHVFSSLFLDSLNGTQKKSHFKKSQVFELIEFDRVKRHLCHSI